MAKNKNSESSNSFASTVEFNEPDANELNSMFTSSNQNGTKTMKADDPANPYKIPYEVLEYTYHHEVFVIHKPWGKCNRCYKAIEEKEIEIPEEGDHVCPHTNMSRYLKQVQRFLDEGHIQRTSREETLVDGSIQVSISWLIPKKKEAL